MLRIAFILLLSVVNIYAQVSYTFQYQPTRIPGLGEFRVIVDNAGSISVESYGLDVYKAASNPPPGASWKSISWISDVGIRRAVDAANKHGFFYVAGIACEIGGLSGSIAVAGRLTNIKERVAMFFPMGASICSIGRMLYNREHKKIEMPDDLVPGIFTIPAGGKRDFAIFSW